MEFNITLYLAHINSSGHWTWLGGNYSSKSVYPAHSGERGGWPGGLYSSSLASIGDTLYLFFGFGYGNDTLTGYYMNDYWSFNMSTGYWTWLGGSLKGNTTGSYSGDVHPGSRFRTTTWATNSGDIFLFGGYGCGAAGTRYYIV